MNLFLGLLCYPVCIEGCNKKKTTLVAILLLVFEPRENTFVSSIATLFQHVFKTNVVVFIICFGFKRWCFFSSHMREPVELYPEKRLRFLLTQ